MNYSQFLNMIPEATLMAILIIVFIADFASSRNSERRWFNPLVCLLMLVQVLVSVWPQEPTSAFRRHVCNYCCGKRNEDNPCRRHANCAYTGA